MIEASWLPSDSGVTRLASLGKSRSHMVWIGRCLKIFQVTGHTGRRGQVIFAPDVTVGTLTRRDCMRIRKGESHSGVVELGSRPIIHGVALLATGGKSCSDVIRNSCGLIVLCVTGVTLGR